MGIMKITPDNADTTDGEPAVKRKRSKGENEMEALISARNSVCDECGEILGKSAWITLETQRKRPVCLACADLDHLCSCPPLMLH